MLRKFFCSAGALHNARRRDMSKSNAELQAEITELKAQLARKGAGRGDQLISLLKDQGDVGALGLADQMGINMRNLSSVKNGVKQRETWGTELVILSFRVNGESLYRLITKDDAQWDVFKLMA